METSSLCWALIDVACELGLKGDYGKATFGPREVYSPGQELGDAGLKALGVLSTAVKDIELLDWDELNTGEKRGGGEVLCPVITDVTPSPKFSPGS